MKPFCLLLLFFLSLAIKPSLAQTDTAVISKAGTALDRYIYQHPIEKTYLHLDREYYLPGDTIWFKAYTVIGPQHILTPLSGVLYCELINSADSVIMRHNISLVSGIGWGDFDLTRSIAPGNYHIRSYTNWMRNAGPEYFFDQRIKIGGMGRALLSNKTTTLQATTSSSKQKPDVQFFPEGGQLISNIGNRVAVKCVNSNGLGENITGDIVDSQGNRITSFSAKHLGMGLFGFRPEAGKIYKAEITTADGSHYTINMPVARDEGYALAVFNTDADSIRVKVSVNEKTLNEKQHTPFYLIVQSGGKIYFTATADLEQLNSSIIIDKKRFPTGIVQFTLFSDTGEPMNERIVFVKNDDMLHIALAASATRYTPRDKVKMNIALSGTNNQFPLASLSAAVINESRMPVNENSESAILSSLLLTSDIKGYIEQPGYYFNSKNADADARLDLLMMTQGYRRFDWADVIHNKTYMPVYQFENALQLAGSIKTPSGKPVPGGKVILTATKQNMLMDTVTDNNGDFIFRQIGIIDTARIVLSARKDNNGKNVVVFLKKADYPKVLPNKINTDTTIAFTDAMLKNIADYKLKQHEDSVKSKHNLKEVKIIAKKEPKPDEFNRFGTKMEYDADMKRAVADGVPIKYELQSIIPGARYDNGKIMYEHGKALLMIDGLIRDADQLDFYRPREIESIRMISATMRDPALLIVSTKRFAGTDTAATILKEVKIVDRKPRKEPGLSESQSLHKGGADQVIMGDDLSPAVTLSDALLSKIAFVHFDSANRPYGRRGLMSVIVDGNVLDGSHLNDIAPNDVYSIEVLRSVAAASIYGSSIAGGALVITLRHGGESRKYLTSETASGVISYNFNGFYKPRIFYSPKYDNPKSNNNDPDLRSTIYWAPNIITDKDGKASFEYFNADTKGTYRIVVEGIDNNGNIGREVLRYKVE
jgi:hypothetical protein